jgi:dienelactone hydrolase
MNAILLSLEEVARRANVFYETNIREAVETAENIGKMVIIDIESGDYAIGENDIQAVRTLKQKNPNARLFGIRIGYDVAVSFGGVMERTAQ